jgi:DNA-binding NtrC family response regulator
VLVTGETGTGKKYVAKKLHYQSSRNPYPFIHAKCASPHKLQFERKLFGLESGVLSRKPEVHKGKLELADKGTVFLDEISEISPQAQKRLFRFLDRREIERIGSNKPVRLDVRIVAATSKNLPEAVISGKFHKDLYYSLCPVTIEMSPLCLRKDEIPPFVELYLDELSRKMNKKPKKLSQGVLGLLMGHYWPGNESELRAVIERAAMLGKRGVIYPEDLPEYIREKRHFMTLAEMERQHIVTALKKTVGNKKKAAALLGIGRTTLYKKLDSFFYNDPSFCKG